VTTRTEQFRRRADAQALEQALNLAASHPLPLTARSLTAEEIATIDHRIYPILLSLYGIGAAAILSFAWFGSEGDSGIFPIAAIIALALLVPVGVVARVRARRRKDYRDPLVSIEAGVQEVTVRDAGREARLDYRDVVIGDFLMLSGARSRALFLGVTLDGPFGPVRLDNMAYENGTITAAAIVARRHGSGLPVPAGRA